MTHHPYSCKQCRPHCQCFPDSSADAPAHGRDNLGGGPATVRRPWRGGSRPADFPSLGVGTCVRLNKLILLHEDRSRDTGSYGILLAQHAPRSAVLSSSRTFPRHLMWVIWPSDAGIHGSLPVQNHIVAVVRMQCAVSGPQPASHDLSATFISVNNRRRVCPSKSISMTVSKRW